MDTDRQWQRWGHRDPYYAVLSHPMYRDGANRGAFLESGVAHFDSVRREFDRLHLPLDPAGTALDYGCGVGRVLGPMSRHFSHCCGLDVSGQMLAEASRNVDLSRTTLHLVRHGEPLPCLDQRALELVHSVLVFQHIPVKRGMAILRELLQSVRPGGKALLAMPIATTAPLRHALVRAQKSSRTLTALLRLATLRKGAFEPVMQMDIYPVGELLELFVEVGMEVRLVRPSRDADASLIQATWYLARPQPPASP